MEKSFIKSRRKVQVADVIRIMLKFIQYYPEVMDALKCMPCLEALGLILYVGSIVYLWIDYIKYQHPMLFRVLKCIYEIIEIIHRVLCVLLGSMLPIL